MDLQPVIIEYLCRQRALSLPGLGTLRWLESKPKRSSDLLFKGPSFNLHHSSNEGTNTDFINYLSNKAKVSAEQASDIVEAWCKTALTMLSSSEEVKISGLGSFVQEEDKVVFKADQVALQQSGDLALSIATRSRSHSVIDSEPVNSDQTFSLWDILLPAILIVLIAILAFSLWKTLMPDADHKVPPITTVEEYEDQDDDMISDSRDTLFDQDTGQRVGSPVEDGSDIDQEEAVIDETSDTEQDEEQEVPGTDEEDLDTDYVEESIQNGEEAKIVSRAKEGECIVVIGSFKRDDLAEKAVEKVVSRGLTAYTEAYGDFTRVGVLFDCETTDLYRRLFQLRGDFGEDAWILKYK